MKIETKEEFNDLVASIQEDVIYREPKAFAIALAQPGQINKDKTITVTYPVVNVGENFGSAAIFMKAALSVGIELDLDADEVAVQVNLDFVNAALTMFTPYLEEAKGDVHKNIQLLMVMKEVLSNETEIGNPYKLVFLFDDVKPTCIETVYLKLYMLSLGRADLRSINLDGAFGLLPNLAWMGNSAIELEYLRMNEIAMKATANYPAIDYVDKFPRFLQHIIPDDNTRILDTSKVRFGAQLAAGTTVMPGASYINFNSGTLGPVMVEGRISSSAVVGAGSDVGGGASILGVLSGTDGDPITIGENCLLGANSVTGIPLGDGCIVDAGLAILPGTKVSITDEAAKELAEVNGDNVAAGTVKAISLSGINGIHFRMDSSTGVIIVKRSTKEVKLNKDLH